VVFGVKVFLDCVGNLEEVGHVDRVADVGVKVILEMLEHVHVFLNVCVSSNSWEGEGFIEEFPSVYCEMWGNTTLGFKSTGNVEGIGPVSNIQSL